MTRLALPLFVLFTFLLVYCEQNPETGIVAIETDKVEEDSESERVTSFTHEEDADMEVFQPTSQWQRILPGQAIPAGLHVRMNLQTGKKEAKLMDGDSGGKYQAQTNKAKQTFVKIDKNYISKTRLKQALKDFKDVFHDNKESQEKGGTRDFSVSEPEKYRSMEEIRKELKGADIFMKKDIEVITDHVKTLNESSPSVSAKAHALEELEYYVHQIDNALDFNTIGGLPLIIKYLNSTEVELKRRAAHVLGSAVQSNPTVQAAALKEGAMPLLLRLLSKHEPMEVRRKAMYALSSLIRLFYKGQQKFLQLNGLETFVRLFDESDSGPLRVKVVTLMTDLLHEQIDFVTKQLKRKGLELSSDSVAEKVPLLKAMVKQGWCNMVPTLLSSNENDTREKVLQALHIMVAGCKQEFQKPNIYSSLNKLRTEWQESSAGSVDPDDYLAGLSQLVSELISKLN